MIFVDIAESCGDFVVVDIASVAVHKVCVFSCWVNIGFLLANKLIGY